MILADSAVGSPSSSASPRRVPLRDSDRRAARGHRDRPAGCARQAPEGEDHVVPDHGAALDSPLTNSAIVLSTTGFWAAEPLSGARCCALPEAAAFYQRAVEHVRLPPGRGLEEPVRRARHHDVLGVGERGEGPAPHPLRGEQPGEAVGVEGAPPSTARRDRLARPGPPPRPRASAGPRRPVRRSLTAGRPVSTARRTAPEAPVTGSGAPNGRSVCSRCRRSAPITATGVPRASVAPRTWA